MYTKLLDIPGNKHKIFIKKKKKKKVDGTQRKFSQTSTIHIATHNYFHQTRAQTSKQFSCLYTVKKHIEAINI